MTHAATQSSAQSISRILVTGAAGYIGSTLVRHLLDKQYTVYGLDRLLFGDHALTDLYQHPHFTFVHGDIRDAQTYRPLLDHVDAVVHLAAIVGDPACSQWPDLARETNLEASRSLFEAAQAASHVQRFVFASTCSNYGKMTDSEYCIEASPLQPLSLYAKTKVSLEKELLSASTRSDFFPTALRFATAYGLSHRMRFDLTVNEFTREVALGKDLVIYGEQFWRPYCHVSDLARACMAVLQADSAVIDHNVFNVGNTTENYTKKQLADMLLEFQPHASLSYVKKEEDPRDYKVNFDKISQSLSFQTTKTVRDGIQEIYETLQAGRFPAPYAHQFSNISNM